MTEADLSPSSNEPESTTAFDPELYANQFRAYVERKIAANKEEILDAGVGIPHFMPINALGNLLLRGAAEIGIRRVIRQAQKGNPPKF